MTGKVIIVTGANSGLGYEAARSLCAGGNEVILACRSEEKGNAAVEKILKESPNALATFMQLDLADLASVRKFVEDFHATGKKLHVLINNAGVYLSNKNAQRQYTKDNFELTVGTNHLGHFLLTNLLLGDLKSAGEEAGEARIVVVASSLHDGHAHRRNLANLDLEDIFMAKPGTYSADLAYKNSKLANVLFTMELAHKLEDSKVTANCLCPGFIPTTELIRNASAASRFFCRNVLGKLLKFTKVTRTLEQGTKAIVDMATSETLKGVSGKYYRDGAEATPSAEVKEELAKSLWELSGRYCHMEGFEPLDAPVPPTPEELKAAEEAAKAAKAAAKKGSKKAAAAAAAEKTEEEKKEEGGEKEAAASGEGKADGADSGEEKVEETTPATEDKEEKEEAGDVKKAEVSEETPKITETAAQ